VDGICELYHQYSSEKMMLSKKITLPIIIIFSFLLGQEQNMSWATYWSESGKKVLSDKTNQKLLGYSALTALAVTQIDMSVKNYIQANKILSDPVSRFGDDYGGDWAHWILWSSIITTSVMNNNSSSEIFSKMQFSTFAMLTNGIITETMKRSFGRVRPNGGCCKSFPSGHTSHSYTIAAIAHELYGNQVGALAYGLATLVAVSRMNDNKHYLSDVIFGAALGTSIGRAFSTQYHENIFGKANIDILPTMALRISYPLD